QFVELALVNRERVVDDGVSQNGDAPVELRRLRVRAERPGYLLQLPQLGIRRAKAWEQGITRTAERVGDRAGVVEGSGHPFEQLLRSARRRARDRWPLAHHGDCAGGQLNRGALK